MRLGLNVNVNGDVLTLSDDIMTSLLLGSFAGGKPNRFSLRLCKHQLSTAPHNTGPGAPKFVFGWKRGPMTLIRIMERYPQTRFVPAQYCGLFFSFLKVKH